MPSDGLIVGIDPDRARGGPRPGVRVQAVAGEDRAHRLRQGGQVADPAHARSAGAAAGRQARRARSRRDRHRGLPREEQKVQRISTALIAHLSGTVRRSAPDYVVLDVAGVGYMVSVAATTRQTVPAPGGALELHIHTHVREDQLALYGFSSAEELELFEMLIGVDGVGPKVGLNILGAASLEVLKRAIVSEDVAPIRRASGVGPRTAAKVIIELKPKLDPSVTLEALT